MKDEFKTWQEAAQHHLDWLLFPRDFDVQSSRGAVASLKRHRDAMFFEFKDATIGDWTAPTKSPSYLLRPMARIAFPLGAKTAGRTQNEWRKVILETVVQRQMKYGSHNILGSGWVGLAVRLGDKVARLDNMIGTGRRSFADDSAADAWLDIVGYVLVACLVSAEHFKLPLVGV